MSTCGANGGSWINPGANCKTTGQVCILGGSCAAQEVAEQGGNSSMLNYQDDTQLSAFRAVTARKLSKLEIYASVAGLQKFTWVVYQKRSGAVAYDLVYQMVTSQTALSPGWIASPPLNYNFVAGKSYAVGVHITGSSTVSYSYSSPARAAFIASSFAASSWDAASSGSPRPTLSSLSADSYYISQLRFTTSVVP